MMKQAPSIRVITTDFQLIDDINLYTSLQIERDWYGIGVLELHINRYLRGADSLQEGRIIFPYNQLNKAYIIRYRELKLDENGKASEIIVIKAVSLKAWLGQRITVPPVGQAYDIANNIKTETAILQYVKNNATQAGAVRNLPDLITQADQLRGGDIIYQTRYKNLAEEIAQLCFLSGLGWNVELDTNNKKFVFKVLNGRNLTAGQSILPPAIFSPEFNTIGNLTYTSSSLNYRNVAVVAGQGEGVERRILTVGTATAYERFETFVDARDVEEDNNGVPLPIATIEERLRARGEQQLKEMAQELYFNGNVLEISRLDYETDYNLGDVVTLQNKEWGVTLDSRITVIKEVYEGDDFKIDVTFDNKKPTIISKVKRQLRDINREITK